MAQVSVSKKVMITPKARSPANSIKISGAKNAALPLMAASILTDKEIILKNVPVISDVHVMKSHLESYGVTVNFDHTSHVMKLRAAGRCMPMPSNSEGSLIRASFTVLGPLIARFKEAKVGLPGGDNIGGSHGRPVNYHVEALKKMGATLVSQDNFLHLTAPQGLKGTKIELQNISVGATQNIVMAACLAEGTTEILNAAMEPEVRALIEMLEKMNMDGSIVVDETRKMIKIQGNGGKLLNGCEFEVIPDRIEAGTWAIAAAVTSHSMLLTMETTAGKKIMKNIIEKLDLAGVKCKWTEKGLQVQPSGMIKPVNVTAEPYPGFPTDLIPQWVTLMTLANGSSTVKDNVFKDRFKHVEDLKNMGANIKQLSTQECEIFGVEKLKRGIDLRATDIRAGAALVLAALVADGPTMILEFQHLERGYEKVMEKIRQFGCVDEDKSKPRSGFHGSA